MDIATIIGLLAAFGLMLLGILQGGSLMIFIDIASLVIVVGGTIGTVLVHFPLEISWERSTLRAKRSFIKLTLRLIRLKS